MSYAFITCFDSVIYKSVRFCEKPQKQLNAMPLWALLSTTTTTTMTTTIYVTHIFFAWCPQSLRRTHIQRKCSIENGDLYICGYHWTVIFNINICWVAVFLSLLTFQSQLQKHRFPVSVNSFIAWQTTVSFTEIAHNRLVDLYGIAIPLHLHDKKRRIHTHTNAEHTVALSKLFVQKTKKSTIITSATVFWNNVLILFMFWWFLISPSHLQQIILYVSGYGHERDRKMQWNWNTQWTRCHFQGEIWGATFYLLHYILPCIFTRFYSV